jgi:hypothetical protein
VPSSLDACPRTCRKRSATLQELAGLLRVEEQALACRKGSEVPESRGRFIAPLHTHKSSVALDADAGMHERANVEGSSGSRMESAKDTHGRRLLLTLMFSITVSGTL